MNKTIFRCPNCLRALRQGEKQYFCPNGHSFDISRKGYVNLLLPGHTGAGNPGDSKEMLQSRRDFLDKGYYQKFSDKLNSLVDLSRVELSKNEADRNINLYDAGCGEGYYISRLKAVLKSRYSQQEISYYGTDVSRDAINYAAGRDRSIHFAVASNYHIPILNNSVDYIFCIFAPRDEKEFRRILRTSGKLAVAVPGARHLYGLKKTMYEAPEVIGQKGTVREGFKLLEETNICYEIHLEDKRDILNLFTMTPYSRHADIENIKKMDRLSTEVDINILIYEREKSV
ncbi:putative RNA methyltransferase [Ruminiclostridium cellobioparum]|jgi:23S rRNA (guanine745-N1)-methyltransferase|uniref:putative RNA methyltransferase n=1 Tax=Ruminiclostridium cellobioparum TaxID=29355 RepID=UPI000A056C9C|nr:methyltransferase domain-containing protein [Ruminiclostridium cellobioparum]